jgi:hypothetical protein
MQTAPETVKLSGGNKHRSWRLGLVLAVVGMASLASLVVWMLVPNEPAYQGRSLSEWLRDFDHDQMDRRAMAEGTGRLE